jgi:halogenation protein CepH
VDPVLSSGVHLATYGAILAARSINACLAGALPEARAFAEFENRYRREFGQFYEFLVSFYDMQRDEQSYFWSAKQVTGLEETESAAFAALVGGLISGDEAVGARLSGAADDLRGAVDRLATADDRRNPLYSSRIVGETFREGRNLAEEAMFGAPLDDDAGTAPGGVVLAADGLGWTTS